MSFFEQLSLWGSRVKRRVFHHIVLSRFIIVGFLGIFALLVALIFFLPVIRVGKDLLFGQVNVLSVMFQNQTKIKETEGRTNVLVLGTGGGLHDGPDLTDSILVVSFLTKVADKQTLGTTPVTVISIPRDIYLESLQGKINTAYAVGEEKQKGAGLILAKGAVSQIVGIPIHYAIQADFSAFQKVIDIIGGVDVTVEHQLDDNSYPIDGKGEDACGHSPIEIQNFSASFPSEQEIWQFFACRYERLHFDPGTQHMTGGTALKFVRSRHAEGDEGTDFARSRRQQLVMAAVKTKFFSTETFLNPKKIEDVYLVLKGNINTDLTSKDINQLVPLVLNYRKATIKTVLIDMTFLDNPPEDQRGWILLPKGVRICI
jgi:LCP family protein required for cell wall assembly